MTIRILRPLAHGLFALVALICASLAPVVHAAAPEKTKLTIAVGGKPLFYYLPLTVAERRGYLSGPGRLRGTFMKSSGFSAYHLFMASMGGTCPRAFWGMW